MIPRLRLGSGLVMLAYVAMHLVNHAMGLVSLAAMERVLSWVAGLWSLWPMQVLLYGGFLVHYVLAVRALWQRRTLRLRASEIAQLVLGFAIPILLARHVVGTRISDAVFGTQSGYYAYVLWVFFVRSPEQGALQMLVLVVAWTHAMLGLHFWLRSKPAYARWRAGALVVAVLVPVLSLLGMIAGGRAVAALADKPGWTGETFAQMSLPTASQARTLDEITATLTWFFVAVVVVVLAARIGRRLWQRRHGVVRVTYPDGRYVEIVRGTSVLEASRTGRIPHASICGGRGRCSTCRVRVRAEPPGLPPPAEDEKRVLNRIGARPNIRLACQLRPAVSVEVTPLLPAFAHAADAQRRVDFSQGSERDIAILFADIRGFTALAEGLLPYDVVFVLNRYFAAMGRAVESSGGRVDKFIGDGVMALFGTTSGGAQGCREALAAARLMSQRLVELNLALKGEINEKLRIGIGIHAGPAIVGEMGYGHATQITAVGDAVNTASRLETLTKTYDCELVVSDSVIAGAGLDRALFHWHEIEPRGKHRTIAVAVLESARELPEPAETAGTPA